MPEVTLPERNTFGRQYKPEAIRQMEAGDKKTADLARDWACRATNSTSGALMMAIEHRWPRPGLVHDTDQGILYATSPHLSSTRI
jgi:hypothetical protein